MNGVKCRTKNPPSRTEETLAHVPDEVLWSESRTAEAAGDLFTALELQEQIFQRGDASYAVFFRLGWLHYLCGKYTTAISFYMKALRNSKGETWPLYGLKNCFTALGDSNAAYMLEQEISTRNKLGYSTVPAEVLATKTEVSSNIEIHKQEDGLV